MDNFSFNRLNNDLLMWESLAPAPIDTGVHDPYTSVTTAAWDLNLASHFMQPNTTGNTFSMCKSAIHYGML